jgi:hypothetical protein
LPQDGVNDIDVDPLRDVQRRPVILEPERDLAGIGVRWIDGDRGS